MFTPDSNSLTAAQKFDQDDELNKFRDSFHFPQHEGKDQLYFAGHSLGLMPKKASVYVNEELDAWAKYGVEGHFKGKHPWLPYHENITASFAKLVGARESEVVAMNTLTVNLHLMMVSFYRPNSSRFKILIESHSFPSDKYAVDSQARYHGFQSSDVVVELPAHPTEEQIIEQIKELGASLSLVMLGNCNYLSGQKFNFQKITQAAHSVGALVGFNLAHGAGNLQMSLHDWDVDFAVWCSYKYLNSGPGGLAGAYIHDRHHLAKNTPRFEGWWGHDKDTRFKMGPEFQAIPTAEAWQLSNPPILQLASLRASMELFDEATMPRIQKKSQHLTAYFDWLIQKNLADIVSVVTPVERGSMLCLKLSGNPKLMMEKMIAAGAIVDFREPNIIRATPAALYTRYADVFKLVQLMKEISLG
jgi:kynureninase